MHRARQQSRLRDIQESQGLLLELVTTEPTILQCFKIIESTCLSQGIFCRIQGTEVSPKFQRFLDDHYLPFCKAAIRAMYTYGFVPWRTRRLGKGDEVPEVLPPGTFGWHTEVGPEEQARAPGRYHAPAKRKRRAQAEPSGTHMQMPDDDDSRLVIYRITPTAGGVREEDVTIYISTPPALDVTSNSSLYATVPSPLSYLLTDYKNMREAQKRRSHADAWNTTARLVSTFKPNLRQEDNPSQYLMDFVHEDHYAAPAIGESLFPNFQAHNVWQREHVMRRQVFLPAWPFLSLLESSLMFGLADHGDALQSPSRGLRPAEGPRRDPAAEPGALRGSDLPAGQVPPGRVGAHGRAARDDHRARQRQPRDRAQDHRVGAHLLH
jgi:hypothetical protein